MTTTGSGGSITYNGTMVGLADANFIPISYLGSSNTSFIGNGMITVISMYASPAVGDLHRTIIVLTSFAIANEVWGVAIDLTAGKFWIAQNNVWLNSSNPATGATEMVTINAPIDVGAYLFFRSGVARFKFWRLDPPIHRRQPEIRPAVWVLSVGRGRRASTDERVVIERCDRWRHDPE